MSKGEEETTSSPPVGPQKENVSPKSEAEVEGKRRIYAGRIAKALVAYKPMTARKILNPPVPQVVKPMDRQEKNCQPLGPKGIDEVLMPIPLESLLDAILTGDTSGIVLEIKTVGLPNLKRALNAEPKSQTRQDRRRATNPETRTGGHDEIGRSKK